MNVLKLVWTNITTSLYRIGISVSLSQVFTTENLSVQVLSDASLGSSHQTTSCCCQDKVRDTRIRYPKKTSTKAVYAHRSLVSADKLMIPVATLDDMV